jgi:hypothetical protein
MSPQLEAVLRELQARRRRAGPWREPDGWVFTSRDWRHPLGETVFNRGWQRLRRHFAERRVRPRIYAHLLPDKDEDLAFLDFDGSCSTSNSLTTGGRGGVVKLPAKSAD